jgi:predicted Zn-dependent protease
LTRVTPAERVGPALDALGEASAALGEGRFHPAVRYARKAKELSPRDASVREVLGLASYRVGDWLTALRELRTYRRLAGESTHLPVEMDALRALGRKNDVEEVWNQVAALRDAPSVQKEGRVIYASFLMDEGRTSEARRVATPKALTNNPHPEDLRLWYVAARAAALDGDQAEATRLRDAVLIMDPGFPGMDELDAAISSTTY